MLLSYSHDTCILSTHLEPCLNATPVLECMHSYFIIKTSTQSFLYFENESFFGKLSPQTLILSMESMILFNMFLVDKNVV